MKLPRHTFLIITFPPYQIKRQQSEQSEGDKILEESSNSLSIHHLQGVFYVYAFSLTAATLVFIAEIIVKRCSGKGNHENNV